MGASYNPGILRVVNTPPIETRRDLQYLLALEKQVNQELLIKNRDHEYLSRIRGPNGTRQLKAMLASAFGANRPSADTSAPGPGVTTIPISAITTLDSKFAKPGRNCSSISRVHIDGPLYNGHDFVMKTISTEHTPLASIKHEACGIMHEGSGCQPHSTVVVQAVGITDCSESGKWGIIYPLIQGPTLGELTSSYYIQQAIHGKFIPVEHDFVMFIFNDLETSHAITYSRQIHACLTMYVLLV
jgi:hypothetical protein